MEIDIDETDFDDLVRDRTNMPLNRAETLASLRDAINKGGHVWLKDVTGRRSHKVTLSNGELLKIRIA